MLIDVRPHVAHLLTGQAHMVVSLADGAAPWVIRLYLGEKMVSMSMRLTDDPNMVAMLQAELQSHLNKLLAAAAAAAAPGEERA